MSAALPRLQALNKYVTVEAETTPLVQLSDEYFGQFSVILVSDCSEVRACWVIMLLLKVDK